MQLKGQPARPSGDGNSSWRPTGMFGSLGISPQQWLWDHGLVLCFLSQPWKFVLLSPPRHTVPPKTQSNRTTGNGLKSPKHRAERLISKAVCYSNQWLTETMKTYICRTGGAWKDPTLPTLDLGFCSQEGETVNSVEAILSRVLRSDWDKYSKPQLREVKQFKQRNKAMAARIRI